MKASPFTYHAPKSVDSAVELLAAADAGTRVVLAGGQSLIPAMALRRIQPDDVVDINGLSAELGSIERHAGTLTIGALVRQRDGERSPVVARNVPLLADAIRHIAHPHIRNRGTIVGCVAFANPAAEVPAVVIALDGRLRARGPDGARVIEASDFFQGRQLTALAPNELITHLELPVLPPGTGTCFREVGRRHGDPAIVGVAAAVTLRDGRIAEARLALAGVADVPLRASAAEDVLRGGETGRRAVAHAADAVADALDPPSDLHASAEYRRHLARVLVGEALVAAVHDARASSDA